MPPPIKYIGISENYEFYSEKPTVEWCDGKNYGGGQPIRELEIQAEVLNWYSKTAILSRLALQQMILLLRKYSDFYLASTSE